MVNLMLVDHEVPAGADPFLPITTRHQRILGQTVHVGRVRVATVVLGAMAVSFGAVTWAYVAYALDPLNSNSGGFGVALALVVFGLPALVLGWLAVRSRGA